MANQEHLDILKQGVEVWNEWREENPKVKPDLSYANLYRAYLRGVDFSGTNLSNAEIGEASLLIGDLRGANLENASLLGTILSSADLQNTNFSNANLSGSYLHRANLSGANLRKADIAGADLYQVNLTGADLDQADIGWTRFVDVDLSVVKGLDSVRHEGPSSIGIDTIIRSHGDIPEIFLRNAGVPSSIIEQIPALIGSLKPVDYYSCFISYSSKDEACARRLYADLQSNNVRCWFAPEDMRTGDKIRSRIDESIRIYDRLLLVLSEHSVASKWVEFEVEAAMDKEQEGKPPILFPVRLDNAVMDSTTAWAAHIKRTRNIGDFTQWKDHDEYQKAFTRLLRDLKASS